MPHIPDRVANRAITKISIGENGCWISTYSVASHVNPAHLRLLSNYENGRRTSGRDWPVGQCINGHGDEHLYTEPGGRRRCRQCKFDAYQRNKNRWNARRKARRAVRAAA